MGLIIALELAAATNKQIKKTPNLFVHRFTTILAYFPLIVHRFPPKMSLGAGQSIANQMLDQT